jgi:glycine cleavage system H protein
MGKPLVFMMGRSPAFVPTDRCYARNHMWAARVRSGYRLGLSAYAVRLLGDVCHLEWSIKPGAAVEAGRQIGLIEGSKATSDLFAPLSGQVANLNCDVLTNPGLLNSNLYDSGWLLGIAAVEQPLLTAEEYLAHLEASWPLAQRLLKGQLGKLES